MAATAAILGTEADTVLAILDVVRAAHRGVWGDGDFSCFDEVNYG